MYTEELEDLVAAHSKKTEVAEQVGPSLQCQSEAEGLEAPWRVASALEASLHWKAEELKINVQRQWQQRANLLRKTGALERWAYFLLSLFISCRLKTYWLVSLTMGKGVFLVHLLIYVSVIHRHTVLYYSVRCFLTH